MENERIIEVRLGDYGCNKEKSINPSKYFENLKWVTTHLYLPIDGWHQRCTDFIVANKIPTILWQQIVRIYGMDLIL